MNKSLAKDAQNERTRDSHPPLSARASAEALLRLLPPPVSSLQRQQFSELYNRFPPGDRHNTLRTIKQFLHALRNRKIICSLSGEQKVALCSWPAKTEYLKSAHARLKRGSIRTILKEVPPMIILHNVLHRGDDPALWCLLAQAEMQVGDFHTAIKTLEYVRRTSFNPKTHSIAARTMGNCHLGLGSFEKAAGTFEESF